MSVLLRMRGGEIGKRSSCRFRFMAAWVTNDSFKDLIKENYCNEYSWPVAISRLMDMIKEWNSEVFDSINKRKMELTNRLSGTDRANPKVINPYLNQLRKTLWKEYEKTLLQEEILWCQRARHKWLQFGDINTKFFHAFTLVRKKRNKVEDLNDDSGR